MQKIKSIKRLEDNHKISFTEVREWYESDLHPAKLNFDDEDVWNYVYGKGNFAGVFQATSRGARELMKRGNPQNITELASLTSIYRPGPLAINADKSYVNAKANPDAITYAHPEIKRILESTFSLLVFQEQMLELGSSIGNLDEGECDRLRKALTKKSISGEAKRKIELKYLMEKFLAGAEENSLPAQDARALWEAMRYQSGYSFNKSHAVSYAIDSYWCAYLLYYYREQWLCAYMETQVSNPDKRANAISELQGFGYGVVNVDVNIAESEWKVIPGIGFMPSLQTVKGVGDVAVEEIMRNRPYKSIKDLLWDENKKWRHSKFNKRAFQNLIIIGAFDSMNIVGKDKLFKNYAHMHAVIIDHWSEIRHAKKGCARFIELIKDAGLRNTDPYSKQFLIEKRFELTGHFDIDLVADKNVQDKFSKMNIRSIEDIENEKDIAWFIILDSQIKYTRQANKPYLFATVVGSSGKQIRMFLWGAKETTKMLQYTVCLAEVTHNDFGYSTLLAKLRIVRNGNTSESEYCD